MRSRDSRASTWNSVAELVLLDEKRARSELRVAGVRPDRENCLRRGRGLSGLRRARDSSQNHQHDRNLRMSHDGHFTNAPPKGWAFCAAHRIRNVSQFKRGDTKSDHAGGSERKKTRSLERVFLFGDLSERLLNRRPLRRPHLPATIALDEDVRETHSTIDRLALGITSHHMVDAGDESGI